LIPKPPDTTMLYHLAAIVLPDGTTVFRGALDQDLGPATDWHWALVGAKGVPPAAPVQNSATVKQDAQLPLSALPSLSNTAQQAEPVLREPSGNPQR